jgi:tetratricopeptide (TPR) repeat protein
VAALAKSVELREALLRDDPENARQHTVDLCSTLVALGQLHWNAARLTDGAQTLCKAVELFEKAAAEGPPDPHVLAQLAGAARLLGNYYWELGVWDAAADFYGKAFAFLAPTPVGDWLRQAYLLMYRGDLAAYRRHCEQMMIRFPQDHFFVVRACTTGPEAVKDMDELVRRAELDRAKSPKSLPQIMNLSMALLRAGRVEQARHIFREGEVGHFFWAVHFALLYHTLGETDEARAWLMRGELVDESIWLDALTGKVVKPPAGSSGAKRTSDSTARRHPIIRGTTSMPRGCTSCSARRTKPRRRSRLR